ncbi:trans-sulfuration enzyme family protein [Occallatibacter riparius]|uniref:PLP-dependent aspartate aminotransferase family protein n=1 Tax=Occallatibacter riparius TaxID=1002689 RepID=A0A9J7BV60_9BACT|nr:PLP-dependent aspartate aminotransferase family protein [Occallatibacter riparius]UWZ86764.1 PLP-dependent aspartate aminotransferase family protein [Occallatibacter riparius]
MSQYKYSTLAVHAGSEPDPLTGAVNVPLYLSSTFELTGVGTDRGWDYSRAGNPTRDRLETALAALEGGFSGHAFTSGMAAITALVAHLHAGDHLICSKDVYGGTARLFNQFIANYGIEIEYVTTDVPEAVEKAIKPNTKLIHLETPSNPLMVLSDIRTISEIAHAKGIEVSVDNTFMSPCLQNPIALGADIVMHSTTKYLNGHSDGIGGALIGSTPEHKERLILVQKAAGGIMSPFECFLVLRGIKTMPLRIKQHEENGQAVAEYLQQHPKVTKLAYPGLKSHPQYDLAMKQQKGFGSMMSFDIGTRENAAKFLGALKIFLNAESLGGVESLASHSATTTHGSVSAEERAEMGITEGRIRLSIGIEDKEDLIDDLDQALAAV